MEKRPFKNRSYASLRLGLLETTNKIFPSSFFAVFAGPSANLDAVSVYPVPYIPNDGKTDNGVPYIVSDPTSKIIFDNLPSAVKIKIFTLSGLLVWDHDTSASLGTMVER